MPDARDIRDHLERFGYLPAPPLGLFGFGEQKAAGDIETALKAFQAFGGIPVTGEVDDATLELMERPRCGFPDPPFATFVLHGNKWSKKDLLYAYKELTPDLTADQIKAAIAHAFSLWSAVTPLTFKEHASGLGDIIIRFVKGDHGDSSPFDGPNKVLAHAYYPPPNGGSLAGDCHFDEDERWVINGSGYDLVTIAAHEIGHALGLAHSTSRSALMYPYYSGPHRHLDADDIAGVQALYGKRAAPPVPEPPKPEPPKPEPPKPEPPKPEPPIPEPPEEPFYDREQALWAINSLGYWYGGKAVDVEIQLHEFDRRVLRDLIGRL